MEKKEYSLKLDETIKNNYYRYNESELTLLLQYRGLVNTYGYRFSDDVEKVDFTAVYDDLKRVTNKVKTGDSTSLNQERLVKILNLYEELLDGGNLEQISFELDLLFLENDMGIRENSQLVKHLEKGKEDGYKFDK